MARSGTTVTGQLLASAGFGYISNFVARFWRAPVVGAMLEQTVLSRECGLISSLDSKHGVTDGLFEPHEFGYFWDRWFDHGQETHKLDASTLRQVDQTGLHRSVGALQRVMGRPISFKNNTWCSLQAGWLSRLFPSSLFVVCRRQPCWIAQSLCLAREERYGSRETWWSIRPSTYCSISRLPWWEQVAAQIVDFECELSEELVQIPSERLVPINYADLCENPRGLIERVASQLLSMGIQFEPAVERLPERLASRDTQRLADADWQLLNDAIELRALARQRKVTR
jgi:hypothetical protein